MSEVIERKLSDIGCEFISGFGFKSSDYINTGIPLIKIGNIQNRIVSVDINGTYIPENIVNDKIKQVFLSNNDVLIAMTGQGSVGRVGRLKLRNNDKALLNQRVGKFVCDEKNINVDYLYYILTSDKYQDYLFNTGAGSGQPNLSPDLILQTEIPWCEYTEQKAIAEVLSSLDDKIDLLHRQNKTLEQMAETLFRQWFVEEAGEDWGEVTFDDVLTISSSKRIFYKEYVDFGIPFYRSKEIIELSKGGTTSTELFISEERFNEIDSKFGSPKEGDILLTSVGTLGVSYQVRKADKFYFKDGNLIWFKDFKLLPSSIVYCWLNSSIGKEELDNISIGSTQAALTISGLKGIDLKIPSPEIIKKVDDELNTIYETFFFNQTQIRTLQSLRDTLLPKLMSGEVRVQYDKEAIHD